MNTSKLATLAEYYQFIDYLSKNRFIRNRCNNSLFFFRSDINLTIDINFNGFIFDCHITHYGNVMSKIFPITTNGFSSFVQFLMDYLNGNINNTTG